MTTTTVHKTSISIKHDVRKQLKNIKNRSDIINKALKLYFQRENLLQKTREDFLFNSIKNGLKDIKNGDIIAINPKDEKIDNNLLEKVLRS